jgi:serine phosphatase RsbU (regulator of sigma subunit)
MKAVFIYNFSKLITWPNENEIDTFRIGIYKDSGIFNELKLMETKSYTDKKIKFKMYFIENFDENIEINYQIIYANVFSGIRPEELFSRMGNYPTLLVTENYQFNSTMINFVEVNNKQRFQLNDNKLNEYGFVVSEKLRFFSVGEISETQWEVLLFEAGKQIETEKEKAKLLQNENFQLLADLDSVEREIWLQKFKMLELENEIIEKTNELNNILNIIKKEEKDYVILKNQILQKENIILEISNQNESLNIIYEKNSNELSKKMKELEAVENKIKDSESKLSDTVYLLKIQKYVNVIIIIILIGVTILGGLSYQNYVKKKKLAFQLEEKSSLLEEKNHEIIDSINYAKRIQDAILPPIKLVKEYLNNSFVLYKPKDIVAGDFYFMESIENEQSTFIYFAAVDCTGHGVPGAMVSVIGSNGLKRCLKEFKLRKTGEILDKLADLVGEAFEQSEEKIRDGMDMALCCLDLNNKKLWFSGANNPLWIFRKQDGFDIEHIEIKADKQPVGHYENRKKYQTHEIDLITGDTIYIFSDGYADQFGGEKGKKFKSVNFKNLLVEIYNEPIDNQKQIISQTFENWKKNIEQVDDVCIIGVRV